MNGRTEPAPARTVRAARPPLLRELLLVAGLFLVYKLGRQLATGHTAQAFRNADRVWDLERAVQLPGEGSVQHLLLYGDTLIRIANTYYATVHFPATAAFLIWLYLRPRTMSGPAEPSPPSPPPPSWCIWRSRWPRRACRPPPD